MTDRPAGRADAERPAAEPARRSEGLPTVSVIVTNHDYGHFLGPCLDSLRAQLHPADQVIVVDDGSADDSRQLLAGREDVQTVLMPANAGQAAAFNAGFALARGEIILFLDADDRLKPDALWTITRLWAPGIAALSFDLETIDANGAPLGHYQMRSGPGDGLRRLTRELAIDFMPTSGNALSRQAVAWAFPLPEPDWRISADALLIRAALFAGPVRHIPRTLGEYRMHGQNGYFHDGLALGTRKRRGNLDIARAGPDLARMLGRAGAPPCPPDQRTDLLRAAVRRQMIAVTNGADPAGSVPVLRAVTAQHPAARGRLALLAARLLLPHVPRLRQLTVDRHMRPGWMQGLVSLGPKAEPDAGQRTVTPIADLPATFTGRTLEALAPGREWHWRQNEPMVLCGRSGTLLFQRFCEGPVWLTLDLETAVPDRLLSVALTADGAELERFEISGRQTVRTVLPDPGPVAPGVDRIGLRLAVGNLGTGLRRLAGPAGQIWLHGLTLEPAPAAPTGLVLPVTDAVPGTALPPTPALPPRAPRTVTLAPPAFPGPACLSLGFGAAQIPGWLDVTQDGAPLHSGRIAGGSQALFAVTTDHLAYDQPVRLDLWFRPDDPLADDGPDLASLGWHAGPAFYEDRPVLMFGSHHSADEAAGLQPFLGSGWSHAPGEAPVLHGLAARLRFALGPCDPAVAPVLRLEIEHLGALVGTQQLVLVAAVNSQPAATLAVTHAEPQIEVPLRPYLTAATNLVEVEIFASVRPAGAEGLAPHGGLRLVALSLAPDAGQAPRDPPPPTPPDMPEFARLLAALDGAVTAGAPAMADLRPQMAAALAGLSARGLRTFLTHDALDILMRAGAALPAGASAPAPLPIGADAAVWLRALADAMLAGPAFLRLGPIRLADLPPCGTRLAAVLGRYLAADLPPGHEDQLAPWADWLGARLDEARAAIVRCPDQSAEHRLATAFVENCRPNRLLFSDLPLAPVATRLARAIEASLMMRGHQLTLPAAPKTAPPKTDPRPRLAILLRQCGDLPETRIVSALLDRLGREVTIYFADTAVPGIDLPGAPLLVGLQGLPLSLAVETIRAGQHDCLVLGSFFNGYDRMTLIAAHRLAPRQIALAAVSPATTGFGSVDAFVLGRLTSPDPRPGDHSEPVVWAPGTAQIFAETLPAARPAERTLQRQRLGVPEAAVLMVSGAMLDKLGAPLLATWADILAANPATILILYPFAPNWNRDYDERTFARRIHDLCAASGIAPDRIRILAPMDRSAVRTLLQIADLYLDSFPYSGATTTVEALSVGLPVVALAGRTQRGHQAAGWLSAFGLEELIATDAADYVRIASRLVTDRAARDAIAQRIRDAAPEALRQEAFGDWFGNYLSAGSETPPAPRYLFHHLPKSGGTSLRKMFSRWFTIVNDYRPPWGDQRPPPVDLATLGPDDLLAGHFTADGMPLGQRYPGTADPARWRRIAFLRDPLELALSIYFFEKSRRAAHEPGFVSPDLGSFLRSYPGIYLHHFECTRDNWREVLGRYWFVGTLERLPDCVRWLADALGKVPPDDLPHENPTPRSEEPAPGDVAIFARNMAHEFEIYRWASQRLRLTLGEQPFDQFTG